MALTWNEIGRRVLAARQAAGLTQDALARELGINRTAVVRMESGNREVDTIELVRLSQCLGRPLEWFLFEPPASVISRRSERVENGEPDTHPVDLKVEDIYRNVEFLIELGTLVPGRIAGRRVAVDDVTTAEKAAADIRRRTERRQEPFREPLEAGEALGIETFILELGKVDVEGSYISSGSGWGVAVVNGSTDLGRRRFTVLHEMVHHYLDDAYSTDVGIATGRSERERLVNAVVIHVLLPRDGITERWKTLLARTSDPRAAAITIAAEYGVSWTALISHLQHLDLVTDRTRDDLFADPPLRSDYIELDVRIPEDVSSVALPPRYSKAVLKAYRQGKISAERATDLLFDTIPEDQLPPIHSVPFEALKRELEPL